MQFPKRREKRYLATIEKRVRASRDLVVEMLAEVLGQYRSEPDEVVAARADAARADAAPPLPEVVDLGIVGDTALLRMVDTARLGRARFPPDEADLLDVARGVDTFTTGQVASVVETVVGIDPASTEDLVALHREWARTNADLITSIDSRFFGDIAKEVQEAVANGRSAKQLGKAIEDRTGVASRRAQLIARDQVATLNGQITKARQEAVGVSRYEWSTSLDERVRPDHEEREGVIFAWGNPPPDGHPGEPINCRCVAIPVFDTVEGVIEEGSIGGLADFTSTPPFTGEAAKKVATTTTAPPSVTVSTMTRPPATADFTATAAHEVRLAARVLKEAEAFAAKDRSRAFGDRVAHDVVAPDGSIFRIIPESEDINGLRVPATRTLVEKGTPGVRVSAGDVPLPPGTDAIAARNALIGAALPPVKAAATKAAKVVATKAAATKAAKARAATKAALAKQHKATNAAQIEALIDGGILRGEDLIRLGGPDGLVFSPRAMKRTKTGFRFKTRSIDQSSIKRGAPAIVEDVTVSPSGITVRTKERDTYHGEWLTYTEKHSAADFEIDIV